MEMTIRQKSDGTVEIIVDGRVRGRIVGASMTAADVRTPAAMTAWLGRHMASVERVDEPVAADNALNSGITDA